MKLFKTALFFLLIGAWALEGKAAREGTMKILITNQGNYGITATVLDIPGSHTVFPGQALPLEVPTNASITLYKTEDYQKNSLTPLIGTKGLKADRDKSITCYPDGHCE